MLSRPVDWHQSPLGPDLPVGEVHLWLADVDAGTHNQDILASDEHARVARFRFDRDRRRWAGARALLRLVLGRYLGVTPESIVFDTAEHGRSVVRRPDHSEWLSFSPSRSGGVALVAVSREQRVGVDLERVRPELDFVPIARRALGHEVADQLEAERDEARARSFFRSWVREEARGKCRGTGLVELDDEARRVPLTVTDMAIADGFAAALAIDGRLELIRGCSMEV